MLYALFVNGVLYSVSKSAANAAEDIKRLTVGKEEFGIRLPSLRVGFITRKEADALVASDTNFAYTVLPRAA